MNVTRARAIARRVHAGQRTRKGEPLIDHVERVAKAVPARYRALAYLHDVLERSDNSHEELFEHGLTRYELEVLTLLTHAPDESYRRYVTRIARAPGPTGRIARTIKLADLDDHLRERSARSALPDYGWARRQIVSAASRRGESLSLTQASAA